MTPQIYAALAIAAASFAVGGGVAWTHQGARLETCQVTRDGLSALLKEQNAAIETVRQQSAKVIADAEATAKQLAEAEARATAAERPRREAIKAGAGPATCTAAIANIRKELKP